MEEKKDLKKKTSNGKKILVGVLAVALIVGTTVAVTLAFLKTISSTVNNTFTASSDIKLGLDEPNYNWNFTEDKVKDESLPNPGDYQPEITYPKDPTLYNLTGSNKGTEEWVAMRVDYSIASTPVTLKQLTMNGKEGGYATGKGGLIESITFDTDGSSGSWIKLTVAQLTACGVEDAENVKYEIYVYKYKLKEKNGKTTASDDDFAIAANETNGGGRTTKLFTEITIKSKQQLADNGFEDSSTKLLILPIFNISLKGAAVKHDDTVKDTSKIESDDISITTNSYKIVKELVGLLQ